MTRVIADEALKARLSGLTEVVEVCDEAGRTLGYLHPARGGAIRSPYSDDEIRELQKQTGGRPLADILRDLESR